MCEKASYDRMAMRCLFLFGPGALLLGLFAAIAVWPDSEYVRVWEIILGVLGITGFVAFFITRSRKTQPSRYLATSTRTRKNEHTCMNTSADQSGSLAVKASWAALGLALGGVCLFFLFYVTDQALAFDRTGQGVLTGFAPRALLYALWAGEGLAVLTGLGSFLLIRHSDITSGSIVGILIRSLCALMMGLFGVVFLWLVVGHIVLGF